MKRPVALAVAVLGATACSRGGGSAACGLASLSAPFSIKQSFAQGQALSAVPDVLTPASLPVRLVAGPLWNGNVASDSASGWHVTVHDSVSPMALIGYGALVVDGGGKPMGVLVYGGPAILGASHIGELTIRDTTIPLLGVRAESALVHDRACPLFPASTP